MFKKTYIATALITASFGIQAATHSFDARSTGMGGIGASSADYLTAAFHNPALVARYNEDDNVGILLPYVAASAQDPDSIMDLLDDFSDIYDNADTSTNPDDVIQALSDLNGNSGHVQVGVGGVIAVPNHLLSFSIYAKSYADAFVVADVHEDDLDKDSYLDPNYNLQSQGVTLGVAIVEGGVAIAKDFKFEQGTFYVGLTPKYQQVTTINYVVDLNDYEFDDWDDKKYQSEDANFNVDFGVAYAMPQGFVFGLVGKNLIEQSYETVNVKNVQANYTLNPVYTASASYNHSLFTVGLDVDLNENERYDNFTEISEKSDNTQMAGLGAEFNAWDWAQVRIGYQTDIADTLDDQMTAGLGISPFGVFSLDLAATYSGDEQFGAAIQTAFTF